MNECDAVTKLDLRSRLRLVQNGHNRGTTFKPASTRPLEMETYRDKLMLPDRSATFAVLTSRPSFVLVGLPTSRMMNDKPMSFMPGRTPRTTISPILTPGAFCNWGSTNPKDKFWSTQACFKHSPASGKVFKWQTGKKLLFNNRDEKKNKELCQMLQRKVTKRAEASHRACF